MSRIIHRTALLDCGVEKAFTYFTNGKLLASWLVLPYQGSHAEVEPKVNGKYEIFWDKKSREDNSTIGCKITAIELNKFVSFDWKGPAQFKRFMNRADPLTHVVVFFLPLIKNGKNMTEVHLIHTGWKNSPEWEEARDYFEKAWSSAFEHLMKQVKRRNLQRVTSSTH